MPCYEYSEKNLDDYEARIEAREARREALERFCPPVGAAKVVTPATWLEAEDMGEAA